MNEKRTIEINGTKQIAHFPKIISASRATDIPAFYSEWLLSSFEKGFVNKINPFNNKKSLINLSEVRFIVFWTKNPEPLIEHLKFFDDKNINYYFQYTLNNYPEYELKLSSIEKRIETFKYLSKKIGKERVIWRFDPIIISDLISEEKILENIFQIGNQINEYTQKLVLSFVDLKYRKVQNNLKKKNFSFQTIEYLQQQKIIEQISDFGKKWNIEIATCAEENDFSKFGIKHNKCIDDELISRIASNDKLLMEYLACKFDNKENRIVCSKALKDKNQRKFCRCIETKDIGFYESCFHGCIYCYANRDFDKTEQEYVEILKSLRREI